MIEFARVKETLRRDSRTWLITGCAGFIGSNLLETLLKLGQTVKGLDNFSTGSQANLDEVKSVVGSELWQNFTLLTGDIRDPEVCKISVLGVDHVLHQAALGSVPRSINDPITTNAVNISGFLNMIDAAKNAAVKSFVYAASSSTYGDHPALPKVEDRIGKPLSPYAVTKYVNEIYADVYARCYGFRATGLRYFNVFGPRQNPAGAYAAVIPKWINAMIADEEIFINGDGTTSRDFCFVENVVQANLLAAMTVIENQGEVYNVAVNGNTSLNGLVEQLRSVCEQNGVNYTREITYRDFRDGDVKHSQADIGKVSSRLRYVALFDLPAGLVKTIPWYLEAGKFKT